MDLEAFSGVKVLLCPQNARRRRPMHLLGSQTLRNYLRAISFSWISEPCEHAYFKALRSPKSFRRFGKTIKTGKETLRILSLPAQMLWKKRALIRIVENYVPCRSSPLTPIEIQIVSPIESVIIHRYLGPYPYRQPLLRIKPIQAFTKSILLRCLDRNTHGPPSLKTQRSH